MGALAPLEEPSVELLEEKAEPLRLLRTTEHRTPLTELYATYILLVPAPLRSFGQEVTAVKVEKVGKPPQVVEPKVAKASLEDSTRARGVLSIPHKHLPTPKMALGMVISGKAVEEVVVVHLRRTSQAPTSCTAHE